MDSDEKGTLEPGRVTVSPSPPSRELFLSCHSSRRCTLTSYPINCGKAIRWVVISASSSNTGCKLSAVDTFNPRYRSLVYKVGIRVIHMVNCELNVQFLVRIKFVRFKCDDFTMIFGPGRNVLEYVSSSLNRETCKRPRTIALFTFVCSVIWPLNCSEAEGDLVSL